MAYNQVDRQILTLYFNFNHFDLYFEKNSITNYTALQHQTQLYIIAAMSENRVIGVDNRLPWHLPDEWTHFRKVTEGRAFLMGRKSYEAPDALHSTYRNVILSSHSPEEAEQKTEYARDMETALALLHDENEVFVLGGASVFMQALPLADKLFLTIVHAHIDGDAYFPAVSLADWDLASSEYHGTDVEHQYSFSMNLYVRKKPET